MESFGVTPSTNTGDSLLRQARDARTLPRGQDTRTYQRAGEAQEVGLRGQHTLTCLWGQVALRMASVLKNTRSLPSSSVR